MHGGRAHLGQAIMQGPLELAEAPAAAPANRAQALEDDNGAPCWPLPNAAQRKLCCCIMRRQPLTECSAHASHIQGNTALPLRPGV